MEPALGPATINLTVLAHTNVGKTTLLRTLVRRDIGDVADRPHVTLAPEAHVLIDTPEGDILRLWDTPGFGDSVRLLKRLRMSGNPIGWLLSNVWDRLADRPFYSAQQALRVVRAESDVLLYLVNAAEDPASARYVEVELEILAWAAKPILLLLNQTGAPRGSEAEAADELAWRRYSASIAQASGPIALDAFARCWVQEDRLLAAVCESVPAEKRPACGRLRAAWRTRNLVIFGEAMEALSSQLAAAATDRQVTSGSGFAGSLQRWVGSVTGRKGPDADTARAMDALARRFDDRVRQTTNTLIALHGLSGRANEVILARLAREFRVTDPADVGTSSAMGGVVAGALSGLTADLAAGGLTFGVGALIGGIVGALGGAGVAHVYNIAKGQEQGSVAWSREWLRRRPQAALLRYLAVAHYGRGRGDWVEGEYPTHWQALAENLTERHAPALERVWDAAEQGAAQEEVAGMLQPLVTTMTREALVRLYPDSSGIFSSAHELDRPAASVEPVERE
jgi:hypothetical protein